MDNKKSNYAKLKQSSNIISQELGNFYHVYYEKLLNLDIESQYITRFLYLCSFANYDNILVKGYGVGQTYIKNNELQSILNLSITEVKQTKKALKDNGLLSIDKDKNVVISKDYVVKGSLKRKRTTALFEVTRIFNNGIRTLYENSTPREHKKLAILIKLLPYINIEHNVVCKNSLEKNIAQVQSCKIPDIARAVGSTNTTRLKRDLLSIKIDNENVLAEIVHDKKRRFIVNPKLYCKSNDPTNLMTMLSYFKNENL